MKILDYGLAKFMVEDDDPSSVKLTMQGMMMGSPLYMPPEQAAGGSIDLHTDVYALGCVLFEMLTGRVPFAAETRLELARQHLSEPVPRLESVRPSLRASAELQTLIETAMSKRSAQRYADASQMRAAFDALPRPAATLGVGAGVDDPTASGDGPAASSEVAAGQASGAGALLTTAALVAIALLVWIALR